MRYHVHDGKIQTNRCELNVVEHCNLSCRSCSHLSPVMRKSLVDPEAVRRDFVTLGSVYHARWLRILGGEPLLHPRLIDVIGAAKDAGIADKVAVVTNGVLLLRATASLWEMIDAIEISQYPGSELSSEELRSCRNSAVANGVDLRVLRISEFRESYSELGTNDPMLTRRIYETCDVAHAWRCHTVADGYFYKCPQSYFLPKLLDTPALRTSEGIRLEASDHLRGTLLDYLQSTEPLLSCTNCLGTSGQRIAHTQARRTHFREYQQRSSEALVDPRLLSRSRFRYRRIRGTAASAALRLPVLRGHHRLK